ncbi:hypothetical protein I4U23_002338 [Adineta vaga]|nr:hypothetical protein I4U23_002338 [Adineta vaga]
MSSTLFYDSDDERDSFDIDRRRIESFQSNFLSASIESSDDDDEGIIDGTKIPSSTKLKGRARHSYLDISNLSSSSSSQEQIQNDDDDNEQNPFDIISKSIDIDSIKPVKKKKKSLGVPKSRVLLDTTDIYDQDDSNDNKRSDLNNYDDDDGDRRPSKSKSTEKSKIRKPTKAAILETERKMQQLSRSEHLVLPTFIPKPLETWHALEKRSRQELLNEIRAKNPSFTPQDPELPDLPVVDVESTASSTLADLTKLIDDKPTQSSNRLNKLSRFLNPDILKKKPTISNIGKESNVMIDLTDTKKAPSHPTMKSAVHISLDCIKSPSSTKKLVEMQKQLGIRMRAKRTAMLADNVINMKDEVEDEEEVEDINEVDDDDSMDSTNESNDANSDVMSTIDKENDDLHMDDEETKQSITDDEEDDEEEQEEESKKENTQSSSNPNRPSLKTILTRLESSSEQVQPPTPAEQNGQTEWFNSARPAQFDSELEMLCSGAFDGENIVPLSQNYTRVEPMNFSPLPPTQAEDNDEDEDLTVRRPKVRQLVDDDDEEGTDSNKQLTGASNDAQESEQEEEEEEEDDDDDQQEEDIEDNEELVDYKKQLFEMEAEESGSDDEKTKNNDDESDSDDDDDEPDEELQRFIDTAAVEIDEDEADNMAKVHLKIKAKEDEHQLKLLKEQYLDFDGDDDGRRIKLSKNPRDDDDEEDNDPDYNSEMAEDEDDDDEDNEDDPMNLKDRMSELERQRSIQDTQAEELHLDEDLDSIGQNSLMFKKGLVLKQKRIQSTTTTTTTHIETNTETKTDSTTKKTNQTRSVTLSSVLLAKRFSSTLLVPVNRTNVAASNSNNTNETSLTAKKQHNPRRHVFTTNITSTTGANENQNPIPSTAISSGEKRSNSTDKSPKTKIKRFKQSTTTAPPTVTNKESSASVFSALALSNTRH